jgi:uncharacterized protein YuzE
LYIIFNEANVTKTIPLRNDKYLGVDQDGKAIGSEVLFSDMPEEAR